MFTLYYLVEEGESLIEQRVQIEVGNDKSLELRFVHEQSLIRFNKTKYSIADIQDIGYELAKKYDVGSLSISIVEELTETIPLTVWAKWLSFGLSLAGYQYRHIASFKLHPATKAIVLDSEDHALIFAHQQGVILAKSQAYARELMNKPANILYPETFVQAVKETPLSNVSIHVLDEGQMREMGFGGLVGVSQGSLREGQLLILEYKPDKPGKTIAMVGKGVTFDSGGISIKQAKSMSEMKFDMGGAAAVIGALYAISQLNLPVHVVGLCGLVENMPSGCALRPGDVVTMLSGKSVEIISTDAEGRMVLADVLCYAQQTYRPDYLMDIATLTGGAGIALGKGFSALMGSSDELKHYVQMAGQSCAEQVWPMPTGGWFETALKSDYADFRHGSEDPHGSLCVAATFLRHFVNDDQKWIHIDTAAMSHSMDHRQIYDKGATGYGVLLLTEICQSISDIQEVFSQ